MHVNIDVGGRERSVLRLRHHAHIAVRFKNGIFDFARIEISRAPQRFHYVVHVEIEILHHVGEYVAVLYDDNWLSVEKLAKPYAFRREFRDDDVKKKKGKHGDYSVQYGNCCICHGYANEVACNERYRKLERLQFAELPLAHKTHCDKKNEI